MNLIHYRSDLHLTVFDLLVLFNNININIITW